MKFPPDQFYIDQIKQISEFFNDAPLYVQLFSSYSDMPGLYKTIKNGVNKKNIIYAPDLGNWNSGLIEDYYAIIHFDCLIKSISTFSSIPQLIASHAITICPSEYFWQDKKLIINKCVWLIRDKELSNIQHTHATL